jgi:type II secretion system protein N
MKTLGLVLACLVLLVIGIWIIAIPESLIVDAIEGAVPGGTHSVRVDGLEKGLFYSVKARRILIQSTGGMKMPGQNVPPPPAPADTQPLLVFEKVAASLDFPSLITLKPLIRIEGSLNGGSVSGVAAISEGGRSDVVFRDVSLRGLAALELFGIKGEGVLSGNVRYGAGAGEIQFTIDKAKFRSTTLGGVFIPLEFFSRMRGALATRGGNTEVKSFTLEGKDVFARITGTAEGRDVSMKMELMPEPVFTAEPLLMTLLTPYKVSPGYYVIPVKTKLVL